MRRARQWFDRRGSRPLWTSSDTIAVYYTFPSIIQGFVVEVAVPHHSYMQQAETVALNAALFGIRLYQQSLVQRRCVQAPEV